MKQISRFYPHVYLEDNKKYIKKAELKDYYDSEVYGDDQSFTNITFDFIRNDLNKWNQVKLLEETNKYFIFDYDKTLKHIKFSKLITNKVIRKAFKDFIKDLYKKIIKSKFLIGDKYYYIMPINNWLQNYMYNETSNTFKYIDVDSFEIVEQNEIDLIFYITHNKKMYKI